MKNSPSPNRSLGLQINAIVVAVCVSALLSTSAAVADEPAQNDEVAQLKARVQQLEEALKQRKLQVAQLEELTKRTPAIVVPVASQTGLIPPTALKTVGPKSNTARNFIFTADGQLQVVPVDGLLVKSVPTRPVESYVAPIRAVPASWSPRQIKGLRYYIVPCAPTTIVAPAFATPAFSTSISYHRLYRFPSLLAPYSSGHVFRYHSHHVVAPRIPSFSYRSHHHSTHHHHRGHFHH
jgi:hypothetical protein